MDGASPSRPTGRGTDIIAYKARDFAKGCSQRPGTYGDPFAATARLSSMKAVLSIAAANRWPIAILDFTLAFLNSKLEKPIYIRQAHGFEMYGPEGEELVRKTYI